MNNVKDYYPFTDDYVFSTVMERYPEIAKHIIKLSAEGELEGIDLDEAIVRKQVTFSIFKDAKGTRFDSLLSNNKVRVDTEMQNKKQTYLAKRSRYYVGINDVESSKAGIEYKALPKIVVIFICTFDPFKLGYSKYVAKEQLLAGEGWSEDVTNKAKYDAEYVKIYLTTAKVEHENVSPELSKFLEYVRSQKPADQFTNELEGKVESVNSTDREVIMTLQEKYDENYRDGIEVGLKAIINSLRPFITNANDMYKAVIKNEGYEDVDIEIVKKLFNESAR